MEENEHNPIKTLSQQNSGDSKSTNKITRFLKKSGYFLLKKVQWMDEHAGFMTFLATAFIALLTYFYVDYSGKQWLTLQQQLDLSQRPSIEPRLERISPLVLENGRWSATVNGALINHGESVALNVGYYAEMFPIQKVTQFGPAIKRQQQWCDQNRYPKPNFVTGYILFPKQTQSLVTVVGLNDKDISAETMGLVIAGCVHYRASYDAPNRQTRQTRYAYILSTSDKDAIMGVPPTKEPTKVFLVALPALWSAD